MSKAYLNALAEEGSRQDLIDWLIKLDKENDELRQKLHGQRVEHRQTDSGLKPFR